MSKFFTSEKIFDNVTRIGGLGGELCYLIEGTEKALLIDGLTGVGSLKAYVRELTDLPVEIALTHGHVDHGGAVFEYGACYIDPADIALLYEHGDPAIRYDFVAHGPADGFKPKLEDVVPPCPVKTYPLTDGFVFDLGGVQIEAISVPGHTKGTMVFLDRARRVVYSGDACNANTLLCMSPHCTTIETYRKSLEHFASFADDFDVMYGGHGPFAVPKDIIADAAELCDRILAGTDDKFPGGFMGNPCLYAAKFSGMFQREDGGLANIAYVPENIRG